MVWTTRSPDSPCPGNRATAFDFTENGQRHRGQPTGLRQRWIHESRDQGHRSRPRSQAPQTKDALIQTDPIGNPPPNPLAQLTASGTMSSAPGIAFQPAKWPSRMQVRLSSNMRSKSRSRQRRASPVRKAPSAGRMPPPLAMVQAKWRRSSGRIAGFDRRQIVPGQVPESFEQRRKARFHLGLARRGNARHGPPRGRSPQT